MEHSVWKLANIIVMLIAFVTTCVINGLSTVEGSTIFDSTQVNLSAKYETRITPAGWTFSVWGFIYTWQALHIVYSLTLLFRKSEDSYLYIDPDPVGTPFYIFYIVSCLSNIGWIFCFDRELLVISLIFLVLIALSLYSCSIFAQRRLVHVGAELETKGLRKDIWLIRILVHNGVAFYCAWTNVASLLNLVIVLQFEAGVDEIRCAWIALGILNAIVVVVFILETFVFDKYTRYTLAHYITLVVALSGILSKKYSQDLPYTSYIIFLAAFTAVLGISKLVITIYRAKKMPIEYRKFHIADVRYSGSSHVAFA